MITDKDIDNLALLSRLELSAEEKLSYKAELNSILEYVGVLNSADAGSASFAFSENMNTMRNDQVTTLTEAYTEVIIAEAPASQDSYVKVKKVL